MDQVIAAAQSIAKQGKTPNTALIKARLSNTTPLPVIIAGLKKWQENPEQKINATQSVVHNNSPSPEYLANMERIIATKIQQAVLPLQAEIKTLKKQLNELQTTINHSGK